MYLDVTQNHLKRRYKRKCLTVTISVNSIGKLINHIVLWFLTTQYLLSWPYLHLVAVQTLCTVAKNTGNVLCIR